MQPQPTEGKKAPPKADTGRTSGPLSQAAREQAMEKIQIGILHGFPPKSVWTELGIHRTTYYRLLGKLGQETHKERLRQSGILLHSYMTRTEDALRRLDEQYAKAENPRDKATIQGELNTLLHQTFDRLQSAGFVPKAKEKLEMSGPAGMPLFTFKIPKEMAVPGKEKD